MEANTTQRMIDSLERASAHLVRTVVTENIDLDSLEGRAMLRAMSTLQKAVSQVKKARRTRRIAEGLYQPKKGENGT